MTDGPQRRPRHVERCFSVADLRTLARRKLPSPLFHYIDGGADDEHSLRRNTAAFDRWAFIPELLHDVSAIRTETRLLGHTLSMPLLCAPTGMSRLFHRDGERAVARAAERAGIYYSLSTLATTSIEDIAAASSGPKMFQVYVFKDRALTTNLIERSRAAKFTALCLTIDTPVAGNRERDRVTGMQLPPRFTLASLASFAAHPGWALDYVRDSDFSLRNVAQHADAMTDGQQSLLDYVNGQFDRTISWAEVDWLRGQWDGPLVIKGIQSLADARRAADAGASALMISNHGGRQLDSTLAPIELVARIRDQLGAGIELIVDGGVRRGSHLLKALALGADACSIGRSYLYGLAAGGEAGVSRALDLLRAELERDMALLGVTDVARMSSAHLEPIQSLA